MTLAAGSRIGVYEVVAKLGEGGMGEVYRATDSNLKRQVAIKVLPASVAGDADRLARFQREAEVLAALNHPNIAAIYGLEKTADFTALVMELVEGDDLSQRIARGAIPIDEALAIAKQIAEALEAAHEQGIIHRDLKPANIKLRNDGTVKVLDFGLAKAMGQGSAIGDQESGSVANSPTITSPAFTQMGMIIGTAAYMAPEQARGTAVDRRADLWAFGVVLYEMLTGIRLFEGQTVSDTLAHVLTRDPDWNALPANTPTGIRKLLRRVLERDRKRRLDSAADARLDIDDAITGPADQGASQPRATKRSWLVPAACAVVGLAVGAAAVTLWLANSASPVQPVHAVQIAAGDGLLTPRISPDGRTVVYVRNGKLLVRPLDSFEATEVEGVDGASRPFWSPDSESIAYFQAPGELRAIPARGGKSRLLAADVFAPFGGAWCGTGVLFVKWAQGIFLASDGNQPRLVASSGGATGVQQLRYPQCLPEGKVLAVENANIVVIDGTRKTVLFESKDAPITEAVYVQPDVIVFYQAGANAGLWRLPVATGLSAATGAPTLMLPDASDPSTGTSGQLVASVGVRFGLHQLVWVDRAGKRLSAFGKAQREFLRPDVIGDGSRVSTMVTEQGGIGSSYSFWIHREATTQPFAVDETRAESLAWSPTADRVAFDAVTGGGKERSEKRSVFVRAATASGPARSIVDGYSPTWTPDGQSLIFERDGDRGPELWIVSLAAGAAPQRLLDNAIDAAISPDGRLLAYTSIATGETEVYVTRLASPADTVPVSSNGGRYARWGRGGELFYLGGPVVGADPNSRRDVFVARVDDRGPLTVMRSERLFDSEASGWVMSIRGRRAYDVAPDGQHLLVQTTGREGTPAIAFIENLSAWLRAKR